MLWIGGLGLLLIFTALTASANDEADIERFKARLDEQEKARQVKGS
jgi:hypothetical protein